MPDLVPIGLFRRPSRATRGRRPPASCRCAPGNGRSRSTRVRKARSPRWPVPNSSPSRGRRRRYGRSSRTTTCACGTQRPGRDRPAPDRNEPDPNWQSFPAFLAEPTDRSSRSRRSSGGDPEPEPATLAPGADDVARLRRRGLHAAGSSHRPALAHVAARRRRADRAGVAWKSTASRSSSRRTRVPPAWRCVTACSNSRTPTAHRRRAREPCRQPGCEEPISRAWISRSNLPPAWRLFAAPGADKRARHLAVALDAARTCSWCWSAEQSPRCGCSDPVTAALTLLTLAMTWHEPGAPRWTWLNLIAAIRLASRGAAHLRRWTHSAGLNGVAVESRWARSRGRGDSVRLSRRRAAACTPQARERRLRRPTSELAQVAMKDCRTGRGARTNEPQEEPATDRCGRRDFGGARAPHLREEAAGFPMPAATPANRGNAGSIRVEVVGGSASIRTCSPPDRGRNRA